MRIILTLSTLAALLVVGMFPAVAGDGDFGRTEDGTVVPFSLTQELQAVSSDPSGRCAPLLTITLVGSGVATDLGAFAEVETDCFNPVTLEFEDVKATITAADGSQLFAQAEGVLIPTGTPGEFEISGSVTFVGGTDRFEAATGSASGSGSFNFGTGQGTNILKGVLILSP
jgi:hypothetical protein